MTGQLLFPVANFEVKKLKRLQDVVNRFFALLGTAQRSLLRWLLSFNPNVGREDEVPPFSWEDWRATVDLPHVVIAVDTIIGVYVIYSVIEFVVPLSGHSILTAIVAVLNACLQWLTNSTADYSTQLFTIALVGLIVFGRQIASVIGSIDRVIEQLPQLAMREEVLFRKWSEQMSIRQMVMSCVSFGAAHFAMILVPLAALPALAFAGAIFMLVYQLKFRNTRSHYLALAEAATAHTMYNVLLLGGLLLWLILSNVLGIITVITH